MSEAEKENVREAGEQQCLRQRKRIRRSMSDDSERERDKERHRNRRAEMDEAERERQRERERRRRSEMDEADDYPVRTGSTVAYQSKYVKPANEERGNEGLLRQTSEVF